MGQKALKRIQRKTRINTKQKTVKLGSNKNGIYSVIVINTWDKLIEEETGKLFPLN